MDAVTVPRRPPGRRAARRWAALGTLLALAGCGAELHHGLDERQANQVVAALGERGIDADKAEGDRPGTYRVLVPRAQQAQALHLLEERGLPRPPARGVGDTFADPGLLPSPSIERARLVAARASDLERALEALPGVVAARVLLSLPAADPLRGDGTRPRSSAAVLLRLRGNPPLPDADLRRLVAAGIEGLHESEVQLTLVTEPAPAPLGEAYAPSLVRLGPLWLPARATVVTLLLALLVAAGLAWLRPSGGRARR